MAALDVLIEESESIDDDQCEPVFSKEVFADEADNLAPSLSRWTCVAVAGFVRRCVAPAGSVKSGKLLTLYEGFSRALEEAGVDGALLEAAGADIILEAASATTISRRYPSFSLKIHASHIHKCAVAEGLKESEEAIAASPADYYWRASSAITREYEGCPFESLFREALTPQPRHAILYTSVCSHSKDALDVTAAADEVSPYCDTDSHFRIKILTTLIPSPVLAINEKKKKRGNGAGTCGSQNEQRMVAKHNLIFARTDDNEWWLLASVDFEQHGSAPPGHWHMNRAPLGEVIPHWGPRGEVFHGGPGSCPLFWFLIPEGTSYSSIPRRSQIHCLLESR
mmetsp:Transcript_15466/g.31786  ORF Transcript_15466/g.31786 Transcript_15466/m.31786 type:complete len:339 (-) Transcript_15466:111-1127(-)